MNTTTRGGHASGRGCSANRPTAANFLISSQPLEVTQSRKRNKIKPEKSKNPGKHFLDQDQEEISEDDVDHQDPRQTEDWKIQKRKGFAKDRENKSKEVKLSKTKKRNSNEPLVPGDPDQDLHCSETGEDIFDFLDLDEEDVMLKKKPNLSKELLKTNKDTPVISKVNLNASKVMHWFVYSRIINTE